MFEQFAKINEVPRPSKHEEQMIDYLKKWGESHHLETKVDEVGNVLIRKPATKKDLRIVRLLYYKVTWIWSVTNWWTWISILTKMPFRLNSVIVRTSPLYSYFLFLVVLYACSC